jgi:dCMP deaminase
MNKIIDTFDQIMNKQIRLNNLFKDIVLRFAQESHCESKKVAVLAVKNHRIIASGINGTAAGQPNCDDVFRTLYEKGRKKSYDWPEPVKIEGREYGMVKIPKNMDYEEWKKMSMWRDAHHVWSSKNELHAEQNLIAIAAREGINLSGTDIYVSLEPCINCAKLLVALRPLHIYYVEDYDYDVGDSKSVLKKARIPLIKI